MKTNSNLYSITINFIDNSILKVWNSSLELYFKDEFKWSEIEKKSLACFEQILIKIKEKSKADKYLFLKNANFIILKNEIIINSLNEQEVFKLATAKNNDNSLIKDLKKELDFTKSMNKLSFNLDNTIKEKELIFTLYKAEVIKEINLRKVSENEKE
ncbi:MSC_0621 family F1-like ATPase epsilon subunit [Mycoplasma sp. 480]|uniref:MSC_0621 family F1-like ATPase epsilon subunit n=1 Tax=Mycoplasma sp. 480 TaxID=3440155 RepID=UPI003F514BC2